MHDLPIFLEWRSAIQKEPRFYLTSNGHEYILMAIDYFTKWVEASSYKSITQAVVAQFLKHNIICRYGVLGELITNNGMNLNGKVIQQFC